MINIRNISISRLGLVNTPVHVAETCFRSREQTQPHNHDFYEIFFVTKGALVHHAGGASLVMKERSLAFVVPEEIHSFSRHRSCKAAALTNIAFGRDHYSAASGFLRHGLGAELKHGRFIPRLKESLWKALLSGAESLRDTQGSSYEKRFYLFRGLLASVLAELAGLEPGEPDPAPSWLVAACAEMEKEANARAGIKKFVELSGRTQEHLARSMRRFRGISATEFINSVKLRRAESDLLMTDNKILEIMYRAGFNNVSHFLEAFRRKHGMTPRDFRNRNRSIFPA